MVFAVNPHHDLFGGQPGELLFVLHAVDGGPAVAALAGDPRFRLVTPPDPSGRLVDQRGGYPHAAVVPGLAGGGNNQRPQQ